jgi:chaperonin GroES
MKKTSTGIFIPEKSQEKLSEGTVLATGSGGFDKDGNRIPMDIKAGDKVG